MDEKCFISPERECLGLRRAEEVARDLKTLDRRLEEVREDMVGRSTRAGERIGNLEAHEQVRDEQYRQVKEKLDDFNKEMREFQKESKDSISELRKEHKDSMMELKKGNKEILDALTPLKHKVEGLEHLEEDVEKLKEKPGETWEHIKKQGLGWIVSLVLMIIAAALGLSKFM